MKNLMMLACCCMAAALPAAENLATNDAAAVERKAAEFRRKFNAVTGGMIRKPGVGKGSILIYNAQRRLDVDFVSFALDSVVENLRITVTAKEGDPAVAAKPSAELVKKLGATFAIFVVENESCPTRLVVAPEDNFAVVNLSNLKSGAKDDIQLGERARKEIVRAFGLLCGAANSQMKWSILGPMPKLEDLDKVLFPNYPIDCYQRTLEYLRRSGVEPFVEATYKRACIEGWAPAPTNEFQRAIWDKVHATPKNPIKIEFDPKSGK